MCLGHQVLGIWVAIMGLTMSTSCGPEPPAEPEAEAGPSLRLISLTPSLTGLVKALGREDLLVGVTKHCDAEGVAVVGDMRPSLPKILKQRPDLTLIGEFSFNAGDRRALRAQGIGTLALRLTSLQDLRRTTRLLGQRLNAMDAAKRLIKRLDEAMEEAKRKAQARPGPGPKVLLVYGLNAGTIMTTGGGDHIAEMVTLLGAQNAAQGKDLTRRLSLAKVVSLNPDVIVHITREGAVRDTESALHYWSSLPTLEAVKTGAIHVWPDDGLAQLGEHTPGALMELAKILEREGP